MPHQKWQEFSPSFPSQAPGLQYDGLTRCWQTRVASGCVRVWRNARDDYVRVPACFHSSRSSSQGPPYKDYFRSISTVCLGSTNIFFLFSFFMPDVACYQKAWVRDFYCPKMSLWLPILMELWHFEFLEGGPKRPKIGKNRWKLDL